MSVRKGNEILFHVHRAEHQVSMNTKSIYIQNTTYPKND